MIGSSSKIKHMERYVKVMGFALLLITSAPAESQNSFVDSSKFLHVHSIQVVSTTANFQSNQPSYDKLISDFSRPAILQRFDDVILDDAQGFSSNYAGFKIAFLFEGRLLEQTKQLDQLSVSFETGRQQLNLFRLTQPDSNSLDYSMDHEVFRITLGARTFLTKRNRRFRFFSGVDWIHEIQISSFLFEGDRKLFADKKYSIYFNVPVGVEWRFAGKKSEYQKYKSLFFSLHLGAGLQRTDPFNLVGSYSGTSFGLSFTI